MRLALPLALLLAVQCAAQTAPDVPDSLKPPAGATVLLELHAIGDQVYACDGSAWALARPDAKLFDAQGQQVGTHFAGPTWEYADHSRVTGTPIAKETPDPDSIPWLLVRVNDFDGDGTLKKVAFIQRLSTKGGKAPTNTVCDPDHKGQESRSHYTADYFFYAAP